MKLHTFFRSSAAFRARIALNLKGLKYEAVTWKLSAAQHRSDDYLGVNAAGLVPTLEDGGNVVYQSIAIIEYLEERYPDPPLLPKDLGTRALTRALALDIACEIHPLNNLRTLNFLKKTYGFTEEQTSQWYRHWVEEGLAVVEARARTSSANRTCLVGDRITMADCFLVPQMFNARRFKCSTDHLPTLVAIDDALRKNPAFAAAAPEAQPDFEAG